MTGGLRVWVGDVSDGRIKLRIWVGDVGDARSRGYGYG